MNCGVETMKINRKVMILAILAGIIVTGMTYSYMNTLRTQKAAPIKYSEVLTAIELIPARTTITEEMLEYKSVPDSEVHADAVLDSAALIGGIATSDIYPGEQILSQRILTDPNSASLSFRVKENMRAMTIPISEVTGIAGYAVPGDHIDILVCYQNLEISETAETNASSMVYTQLQNIQILEEGIDTEESGDNAVSSITSFTVMVSPEQAEVLAYAIMNGSIQCALRNPVDNVKAELQMFGDDNFSTWRDR